MQLAHVITSVIEPTVLKQDYRDAMARLGAAVNVITTDGPQGRAGFTATAVCSVTDEPPTLLVCLNRSASVYPVFKANGTLCVNTLSSEHRALSTLFGGKTTMEERFIAAQWHTLVTGSPALDGAAVSFDCRISAVNTVGTHDVLLCEVVAIERRENAGGLIYFNRVYHDLCNEPAEA
ncbi:flavin reductase [Pseudomonas duriflava]|uniref:FMN reductase (NADH) RutF n=1 Tax=Pseudomonas duriflava TaxID=459528 RepID=A0A562Q6M5_9PSED|nr:pyrimidine utilization flavin reductase protein F [Pseudomonas duriflava]TWI52364.1 flavin reductase [Pseudomonas duriflava]